MAFKEINRKFVKITGTRLSINSRLNLFNILQESSDNVYLLNIFRAFTISDEYKENNIYFELYEAEENDWWDNISYKYYESSHLWWLVCEMNDIYNPFEQLEEGQLIKVLREDYLYNVFKNLQDIAKLGKK